MTEPNDTPRKVPPLLLEQLALGELDPDQARRVEAELARTGVDAGEALARIEASNAEILADYPAPKLAADIQRRLERGREPKRAWIPWVLAPTLVAAAAVAWIVVRPPPTTIAVHDTHGALTGDGDPEVTRIKGAVDAHLVIDRRTGSGHERLAEGETAREGDLLQLSYVAAGQREGVILSIDGAGAVTLHHPSEASDPPTLTDGEEVPLTHAYELDDAPSFERFVFVTRDGASPSVAEVLAAAEQLASDPSTARTEPLALAGEGWQQHSLVLRKPPAAVEGAPPSPTPAGEGL
ncbi:hypothetical protein [Enhygromyxa salina]|uniref:ActD-like protein n=1 Tax=Enhygromyxa salina TaxID=215803 RepID=A0A2S9YQA9_9BACT|nr:hypothetical protein [Enhygromyxa salina]PRQ07266.1 hypothetical protein ENSA7_29740 [Enhygromyxa salina]